MPYAQISVSLNIPVGSIGPRRGRCLDKLRRDPVIAAVITPRPRPRKVNCPGRHRRAYDDQMMACYGFPHPRHSPADQAPNPEETPPEPAICVTQPQRTRHRHAAQSRRSGRSRGRKSARSATVFWLQASRTEWPLGTRWRADAPGASSSRSMGAWLRRLTLKANIAVPWRLPSFRRRRRSCLRQASWFISGLRNGHLNGGTEKTAWPVSDLGPQTQVLREQEPLVRGAGDRASPAGRRLGRGLGRCLLRRVAHAVVPRPGCPAARRGRRAGVGCGDLRLLRAANGGTLSGFFDVFAWQEPGRAAFFEVKVGPDRIKPTQLRFAEIALRFRRL